MANRYSVDSVNEWYRELEGKTRERLLDRDAYRSRLTGGVDRNVSGWSRRDSKEGVVRIAESMSRDDFLDRVLENDPWVQQFRDDPAAFAPIAGQAKLVFRGVKAARPFLSVAVSKAGDAFRKGVVGVGRLAGVVGKQMGKGAQKGFVFVRGHFRSGGVWVKGHIRKWRGFGVDVGDVKGQLRRDVLGKGARRLSDAIFGVSRTRRTLDSATLEKVKEAARSLGSRPSVPTGYVDDVLGEAGSLSGSGGGAAYADAYSAVLKRQGKVVEQVKGLVGKEYSAEEIAQIARTGILPRGGLLAGGFGDSLASALTVLGGLVLGYGGFEALRNELETGYTAAQSLQRRYGRDSRGRWRARVERTSEGRYVALPRNWEYSADTYMSVRRFLAQSTGEQPAALADYTAALRSLSGGFVQGGYVGSYTRSDGTRVTGYRRSGYQRTPNYVALSNSQTASMGRRGLSLLNQVSIGNTNTFQSFVNSTQNANLRLWVNQAPPSLTPFNF